MDMSFSQFSGTAIVPTLSRLVLALAFITVGFNKLTTDATFNADQAQRLKAVGVDMESMTAFADPLIIPARNPQEEGATQPPAEETTAPPEETKAQPPEGGEHTVSSLSEGQYTARKLHVVTLYCEQAGFGKYSPYLAWLSAVTEFGGGILLLVGFLSRIWGLGLAINMGMAIYLTTWGRYIDAGPFAVAQGTDGFALFHQTFAQLSLCLLALGVFLTGPGPLSLDRLVFGRRGGDRTVKDIGGGPAMSSLPASGPPRSVVPERRPQPKPEESATPPGGRPL
jgi:uncharacterized membrane protein YphA (DoxX/SURF4 family)